MSSFDIRRLRYFVSVAELGSITRAAIELHIAQPALSHQIRLLENEIGGALFTRGSQGVRLTELGKTLMDGSRQPIADLRALRDRLKEGLEDPAGTVAIGVAQTIGPILAVPLLELAGKRLPRVRIHVRELPSSDIPDLLRGEAIDFALSYGVPSGRGIHSTQLFSEDLFLFSTSQCAKRHLADPKAATIEFPDLRNIPLCLSARSNGFRDYLERVARNRRVVLDVTAEVDSVSIRKDFAMSGAGFAILSGAIIRKEISRSGIFAARITSPRIQRSICFVRQSGSAVSRAAREVAALVAEVLSPMVMKDMWPGAVLPAAGIPRLV